MSAAKAVQKSPDFKPSSPTSSLKKLWMYLAWVHLQESKHRQSQDSEYLLLSFGTSGT